MNKVLKEVLSSVKIWVFIVFILISILSINYKFDTSGISINKVIDKDLGIASPDDALPLTKRELIISANSEKIKDMDQFYSIIKELNNDSLILKTNKGHSLVYESLTYNDSITLEEMIGLSVGESSNTNLRFGIDLKGGIRAVLKPDKHLTQSEMKLMIDSLDQRLNAFGLSNVVIRTLEGQYILIEMAGMSESEFKETILSEGVFEAKIGNVTVFEGGDDIAGVCKVSSCAGIDPYAGCSENTDGTYACRFRFEVYETPKAAQRFYETIQDIPVESSSGQSYLTKDLELYLDGNLQDVLKIAASLKNAPQTTIVISGSGSGTTMAIAQEDALDNMKKLQVILESGSLPAKLNIESLDVITADLGELFLKNSMLLGIVAVAIVSILIFVFYRRLALSSFIILTMMSEVLIVLGFAALLKWDLDLVAIAGIIISVGTGVDDQIIITDEALGKSDKKSNKQSIKKRLANAFFIMFGAYFTTVVAMLPLFKGVQLLRGFAFTTILGVTIGVIITRPAYAKFIEIYLKNTKDKNK